MTPTWTAAFPKISTLTLTLLVLAGCSSHQLSDAEFFKQLEDTGAGVTNEYQPTRFDEAKTAYQSGVEANLALFAPIAWDNFDQLMRAAVAADKADSLDASNQLAEKALKAYEQALTSEEQVKGLLQEPTRLLSKLDKIKADRVHKKEFQSVTDDYRDLAETIEKEGAQLNPRSLDGDIEDLVQDMNQLQIDTLLTLHWLPAQETIDRIEDRDLEDFAPRSFLEAHQMTNNARIRITENFANPEACEQIGLEALRSAQHALYVGQEVRKILNLNKKSAEETILRFEEYLHRIGDALDAGDQRNMALIDQSMSLVQKAQEMRSRIEEPLQSQIDALQLELDTLKALQQVEQDQQAEQAEAEKASNPL